MEPPAATTQVESRSRTKRAWWALALLCCFLAGLCPESRAEDPKLLIAVVDRIAWQDLAAGDLDAPVLRGLAENGAVGLMCVRSGRGEGGAYLSIGAGSRASAVARGVRTTLEGYAFQASEKPEGIPASRSFQGYSGWPAGDNAVIHLGIGELIRQNEDSFYPVHLGLLGGALRRSGLRVACLGNADTADGVHREAVCIAMDEQGLVELGEVSDRSVSESASVPYRLTTDTNRLLSALRRAAPSADLIVLDLGETSRVEEYAQRMAPGAARTARLRAIARADRILGRALDILDRDEWGVLVLTPNARRPDPEETLAGLAPVILRLPGGRPGLLTSPSTGGHLGHSAGLVLNTDVAPTVLDYFGLDAPPDAVGRPMAAQDTGGDHVEELYSSAVRHDSVEGTRRGVFRYLPVGASVVLFAAAFLLALGDRSPRWACALARGVLVVGLAAPVALLAVALRPSWGVPPLAAAAIGALGIAFLGGLITGWRSGHVLPAVALVGLLVYDLVRGQTMLAWSPLSYSPAGGARFYGIGNEYAGALLGAALVSASGLLSRRELAARWEGLCAGLLLAGIVVLVGYPSWGANLGMAIGCAVGFGVFTLYLWRRPPTAAHVVGAMAAAVVVVAAAIVLGVLIQGMEASHVGRLLARFQSEGWTALSEVVARKISMNWLLVRFSAWTEVAAASLSVLAVALVARPPALARELADRPWLGASVAACVAGSAAAFLLNDSGIVGAALGLFYAAAALAYVGLSKRLGGD